DSTKFQSMLFASVSPDPTCNPGSTHACITDANGICSVVYRRMRDHGLETSIGGIVGTHSLTPSVTWGGSSINYPLTLQVVNPTTSHPSYTIFECLAESRTPPAPIPPWDPSQAPVLSQEMSTGLPGVVNFYPMATSIDLPAGGGILTSCVVTVWDSDGS